MKMTKMTSLILAALLAATAVCATGCGSTTEETEATTTTVAETVEETEAVDDALASDVTVLGEGETMFYFDVVDADAQETDFEIHTDATTVGDALVELDLIQGEDSDYGLYVKTVNGITADYDVDGTYWAFYIDGEYASTGVDATDITAGSTYAFKVEQ